MNKEERAAYHRKWYAENKVRHKANAKRIAVEVRKRNREYVNQRKTDPCVDCGQTFDPVCMDFDHLDSKLYNVADLTNCSMAKLIAEIAKCEVVCSNCHRIRTRDRLKGL